MVDINNDQQSTIVSVQKNSVLIKRILIVIAIVLILAGISFGVWYFIDLNNKNQKITEQSKILEKAQESFNIYNNASSKAISGDYTAGLKILDDAINNTTINSEKAKIYLQESSIAFNLDKFDDAYEFAKKAEDLYLDVNSAKMMAAAQAKRGNTKDAIVKYELALSRITGNSELDELDKQDIRNDIKKLGN